MKQRPRARATATDTGCAIREMALQDLPQVFALGQRLFTAEKWPTLYRSWDQYEIVELFDWAHLDTAPEVPVPDPAGIENGQETRRIGDRRSATPDESGAVSRCALFDSDGEFCLVAEAGNRIVGFALGTLMEKHGSPWRYGWLLWLGISLRHRGRGIAARLLSRLADLFILHGARIMLVDTDAANEQAIHFFREQGFGNDLMHVYFSRNFAEHPSYIQLRARQRRIRSLRRRRLLGARVARGKKSKR